MKLLNTTELCRVTGIPRHRFKNLKSGKIRSLTHEEREKIAMTVKELSDSLKGLANDVEESGLYSDELKEYINKRAEIVNREHADNPTGERLDELELLGELQREVEE
jgi:hypothetical protein